VKPPRTPLACLAHANLTSSIDCNQSQTDDVMAAHSAVRAINSQEITDKARRDLLHLLEGVCKILGTASPEM